MLSQVKSDLLNSIKKNPAVFNFINASLKNDLSFIKQVVCIKGCYPLISDEFKDNDEVSRIAIEHGEWQALPINVRSTPENLIEYFRVNQDFDVLKTMDESLRSNKHFFMQLVQLNGDTIQFANDELKDDAELAEAALREFAGSMIYISNRLKCCKQTILSGIISYIESDHFCKSGLEDIDKKIDSSVWHYNDIQNMLSIGKQILEMRKNLNMSYI